VFVTRATRHDQADIEELLGSEGRDVAEPRSGSFFLAREGAAVGCARLWEVAPQTLVVRDVVVASDRRREGIGSQLMRAAMNSRGGTLYLRCTVQVAPFFERFGFAPTAADAVPEEVAGHFDLYGSGGGAEGAGREANTTMKAR
jgi:N-acetylglutamate synthase-like GNAT family acetyltransferase